MNEALAIPAIPQFTFIGSCLTMELIKKYFAELSAFQFNQFSLMQLLYYEWNEKINLISRKDIDQLYERHILHSLAIAKFISFNTGTSILDIGTGGGFPGIPLAILFPDSIFYLVDSVGKKISAAKEIAAQLGLSNVRFVKARAEEINTQHDFVISRAVADMKRIYQWTAPLIKANSFNRVNNGWLLLKGGDLKSEIDQLSRKVMLVPVSRFFEEDFFKEKSIVYFS